MWPWQIMAVSRPHSLPSCRQKIRVQGRAGDARETQGLVASCPHPDGGGRETETQVHASDQELNPVFQPLSHQPGQTSFLHVPGRVSRRPCAYSRCTWLLGGSSPLGAYPSSQGDDGIGKAPRAAPRGGSTMASSIPSQAEACFPGPAPPGSKCPGTNQLPAPERNTLGERAGLTGGDGVQL